LKKKKYENHDNWLWLYVTGVISFAFLVNIAMYIPIPTLETLDAPDWLSFWGGYLGGVLGCIPAFAALKESQRQAKKQHEENQTDRRLQVMPVFNCRIFTASYGHVKKLTTSGYFILDSDFVLREPDYDEYPEKERYDYVNYVEICNCGLGPALGVKLSCNGIPVDLFHFKHNDTFQYLLEPSWNLLHKCKSTAKPSTLEFNFVYTDVFGNEYSQSHTFPYYLNNDINGLHFSFKAPIVKSPSLTNPAHTGH